MSTCNIHIGIWIQNFYLIFFFIVHFFYILEGACRLWGCMKKWQKDSSKGIQGVGEVQNAFEMKTKMSIFVLFCIYNVDYTYCFQNKHYENEISVPNGPQVGGEGVFSLPTNRQSKVTLVSNFENSWNKICKKKKKTFE